MNTYSIFEGNMEKLLAKCETIRKKCIKNGCTFTLREVGEEFDEYTDENGVKFNRRFVLVEVEGTAIVNGWQFLATIQHTSTGKIITKADADIQIPDRFYSADPICEHCSTKRARKDTYIVYNLETKEYKQVGKSCLKEYTHGLSAELVASYLSWFKEVEEVENFFPASYSRGQMYHEVDLLLAYACETVKHWGYIPASFDGYTTSQRCSDYFYLDTCGRAISPEAKQIMRRDMEAVGFNPNRDAIKEQVQTIKHWVLEQKLDSEYIRNLQTICKSPYVSGRNFGILISAVQCYSKAMAIETRKKAEAKKTANSTHQGEIGKRHTFTAVEMKCLSSYPDDFGGYCYFYQMLDAQGNVYTWSTSKGIDTELKYEVTGTVKAHTTFRNTQQTQLTRCKLNEIKEG